MVASATLRDVAALSLHRVAAMANSSRRAIIAALGGCDPETTVALVLDTSDLVARAIATVIDHQPSSGLASVARPLEQVLLLLDAMALPDARSGLLQPRRVDEVRVLVVTEGHACSVYLTLAPGN